MMIIYWTIVLFYANFSCAHNKYVIQPDSVMVTDQGRSVSLTCFCQSNLMVRVSWFKQSVGQKPLLMTSFYHRTQKIFYFNNFTKDFNETKRLSVKRGVGSCNLTISKTESGDSATYYCGAMEVGEVIFGEGTFLIVKDSGSNSMSVLQKPLSKSVQRGDSVTLNCTIHTETCAGEHSVYWFRHGSGESRSGIIYNNGDRSDQCERSPEAGSPTQSCVYNLHKRNLSLSDSGTYYCAVVSCGEILFGKGTKLDYGFKEDQVLLVYCLGVALALCFILIIVLGCVIYKMTKRNSLLYRGMHPQPSGPIVPSSHNQDQEDDDPLTSVHYAALNVIHKKQKTQRQRSTTERDTVYSGVRC
uniref:Ig-like domain-containing protein n=1 Tax=Hucho hucho TaxID=62062 RepID=A0A4W5RXE6_9TELE